jgi:hypothetical protein
MITAGKFMLRPGCRLREENGNWTLVDELFQVKVPMNESAFNLISTLEDRTSFSEQEMDFLNGLIRMSFLTDKALLKHAMAIARGFKPIPGGAYRTASL